MITGRRKGFTLIELLVVIAIIGILAAMVFPVFARARESARKVVCLSNVKNIALAIQMYLADNNDTFPPGERNRDTLDYWATAPGGGGWMPGDWDGGGCGLILEQNPYLRWPVILDEYVKNREVYTCPSAKIESAASFIVGWPNYMDWYRSYEGVWGNKTMDISYIDPNNPGPCHYAWPSGWGGRVTDSCLQNALAGQYMAGNEAEAKAFRYSISGNEAALQGAKMASVQDPVRLIVIYPAGAYPAWHEVGLTAFPDICAMSCGNCGGGFDWEACASTAADCGLYLHAPADGSVLGDGNERRKYARHLGGVNLGFADGHASWYASDALVALMTPENRVGAGWAPWGPTEIHLDTNGSAGTWGPASDCGGPGSDPSTSYPGMALIF